MLWRDGGRVALSPAQAGLLSVAFGDGRGRVPRSLVQRLLWAERDGKAVRHRASQLVYQTNQRCKARVLEMEREHVRVCREIVACDLDEFAACVAAREFGAACDLLERGFLAAFRRPRLDALADWIEERRLSVRARLRFAAMAGWQAAETVQDWEGARKAAQALLRIDPRDEMMLRRVMRAQAMGGRVREAEAIYRAFADRAESEAGWAPEAETRQLLRSVQGSVAPTSGPGRGGRGEEAARRSVGADGPGAEAVPGEAPPLPFRRRGDALVRVNRGLRRSGGGVVTVSGEAGIGKTRLAEMAMRSAGFQGLGVVWSSPAEAERHVPMSTLARGLDQPWAGPHLRRVAAPWRSLLAALLPSAGQEGEEPATAPAGASPIALHLSGSERLLGGPWAGQVREAFRRLFDAMARTQQIVFLVDDFHWADEESASILQSLCEPNRALPFRLLLAYRPEEMAAGTATARLVRELEADSRSTAIHLRGLDDAAAREVAAAANPALFGTVSEGARSASAGHESTLDEVVRLAGGNPRFLTALASHAKAEPAGRWTPGVAGGAAPPLLRTPPSVRRLVQRRIGQLDQVARKVAAGMAVFGQPASLEEAARLAACSRGECADGIERLQELGVVEWSEARASFRHEVVRQAMYEEAAPARRAFAHGVAAKLLRARPQAGPLDRVAHHYFLAGERGRARKHALAAEAAAKPADTAVRLRLLEIAREASDGGERCAVAARLAAAHWEALQLREALRAAKEALACSGDLPSGRVGDLRLVQAEARWQLGLVAPQAALKALDELEAEARGDGNEFLRICVLDARLAVLSALEDAPGAQALLRGAARSAPRLQDVRARCRGLALLAAGEAYVSSGRALQAGRDAWALAEARQLHRERMIAGARYVEALADAGLLGAEEGRAAVENARTEAVRSGDLHARAAFLLALADWHVVAGNRRACDAALEEVRELAAEPAFCPPVQVRASLAEAAVALDRGNLSAAGEAMARAREAAGSALACRDQRILAGLQGELFLQSGKVRRAIEVADHHPLRPSVRAPLGLLLFHARLQARIGRPADALARLDRGLQDLDQRRNLPWLRIALDLVRLARRTGAPRRKLARTARARAQELGLPGLAHELGPFTR